MGRRIGVLDTAIGGLAAASLAIAGLAASPAASSGVDRCSRAPSDAISIGVANLAGGAGIEDANALALALDAAVTANLARDADEVVVCRVRDRALDQVSAASRPDAVTRASLEAERLRDEEEIDVLVWGAAGDPGRVWFTGMADPLIEPRVTPLNGAPLAETVSEADGSALAALALARSTTDFGADAGLTLGHVRTLLRDARGRVGLYDQSETAQTAEALTAFADAALLVGERTADPDWLEDAAAAFRQLEAVAQDPLDRGRANVGLAEAIHHQGVIDQRAERLDKALATYDLALEDLTRASAPGDWTVAQMNRAETMSALAGISGRASAHRRAAEAYRQALKEVSRDTRPLDWASAQNAIADNLAAAGAAADDRTAYLEAAGAYAAAQEEWGAKALPFQRAWAGVKQARALMAADQLVDDTTHLPNAIEAYRGALASFGRAGAPAETFTRVRQEYADVLAWSGGYSQDAGDLREAITVTRAVAERAERQERYRDYAQAQMRVGGWSRELADLEASGREAARRLAEAADAFSRAEAAFSLLDDTWAASTARDLQRNAKGAQRRALAGRAPR